MSGHESKTLAELPVQHFDGVVTICGHANETCPFFPGRKIHRGFDDQPKLAADATSDEETLAHYSRVYDEIRAFVLTLPQALGEEDGS